MPESTPTVVSMTTNLRLLPAVEVVAATLRTEGLPTPLASQLARQAIDYLRASMLGSTTVFTDKAAVLSAALLHARLAATKLTALPLPQTINATGTVLHTGLGRAPLSVRARAAVSATLTGYCQLEFNLDEGTRGDRQDHVEPLLRQLTGCAAALVVNNCAGATVLMLQALAQGREVIVSRGELVEIGGSFRVPEIMAAAGCRLVEVGSTNKTRLEDYRRAITANTALLLKVHKSNFIQEGFVAEVTTDELVALGTECGIPVGVDQGSGCLVDLSSCGIKTPRLGDELAAGAGLVCCSGDKLLGGPQAGLILGSQELVNRCKRHPLARALRVDKLVLAALAGTLQDYLLGDPLVTIPTLALLSEPLAAVKVRAEKLLTLLPADLGAVLEIGKSAVGSGAAPTQGPATWMLALRGYPPDRMVRALRNDPLHVIARIARETVFIDVRTVADDEVVSLAAAIIRAIPHATLNAPHQVTSHFPHG
jgi:L-seryl-tRNA(Ser) seleniumtransferase